MSNLANQPTNPNFLPSDGFHFTLKRAPNVMFFAQEATLPSISVTPIVQPNPFQTIWRAAHPPQYGDFALTFAVDEDMQNYMEIYNWMNGFNPDSPDDYAQLIGGSARTTPLGEGEWSDGTLTVMTSAKNPNIQFTFHNMFPIELSTLTFATTKTDVDYLQATVTFKYHRFYIQTTI